MDTKSFKAGDLHFVWDSHRNCYSMWHSNGRLLSGTVTEEDLQLLKEALRSRFDEVTCKRCNKAFEKELTGKK